jgi:hypothetical protein
MVDEGADLRLAVEVLPLVQDLQVVECRQNDVHPLGGGATVNTRRQTRKRERGNSKTNQFFAWVSPVSQLEHLR